MFVFKNEHFFVYHGAAPQKAGEKHDGLLPQRGGETMFGSSFA
jgi:hypothetical protein